MAARKKAKTRKSRVVAKKAAKARKQPVAGKKAAPTRKRQAAVRKAVAPRPMPPPAVVEIDQRIAVVRANLRDLVEQAASNAGAATEELMSTRIAGQEEKLRLLTGQRDELLKRGS